MDDLPIPPPPECHSNATFAIVEEDAELRDRLVKGLEKTRGYRCVCHCGSSEEALQLLVPSKQPEVVLINLPGLTGVECIRRLKRQCPSAQVLVLTVHEDSGHIFEALKAGACGYLLKPVDPSSVLRAIQEIKLGGAPMSSQIARRVVQSFFEEGQDSTEKADLSSREREILGQLSKGHSSKEIADQLTISYHTVRVHLKHIYEKLHVRSRTEAIIKYMDRTA